MFLPPVSPPTLAGPFVSLRCVAKGDPSPTVRWFVYGLELEEGRAESGGVTVGTHRSPNGDVVSHLNITHARTKHGGTYECRAASKVGSVSHSAKLNVRGAPFVRKMRPMKVRVKKNKINLF